MNTIGDEMNLNGATSFDDDLKWGQTNETLISKYYIKKGCSVNKLPQDQQEYGDIRIGFDLAEIKVLDNSKQLFPTAAIEVFSTTGNYKKAKSSGLNVDLDKLDILQRRELSKLVSTYLKHAAYDIETAPISKMIYIQGRTPKEQGAKGISEYIRNGNTIYAYVYNYKLFSRYALQQFADNSLIKFKNSYDAMGFLREWTDADLGYEETLELNKQTLK
jgi:hypothetical protein